MPQPQPSREISQGSQGPLGSHLRAPGIASFQTWGSSGTLASPVTSSVQPMRPQVHEWCYSTNELSLPNGESRPPVPGWGGGAWVLRGVSEAQRGPDIISHFLPLPGEKKSRNQ